MRVRMRCTDRLFKVTIQGGRSEILRDLIARGLGLR
jgi:hypothetical protein